MLERVAGMIQPKPLNPEELEEINTRDADYHATKRGSILLAEPVQATHSETAEDDRTALLQHIVHLEQRLAEGKRLMLKMVKQNMGKSREKELRRRRFNRTVRKHITPAQWRDICDEFSQIERKEVTP